MLNFQVACAQKFQTKNDLFLRCQQICNVAFLKSVKILGKMIRSKYRRTTPEIPVFFILRCLKMHN